MKNELWAVIKYDGKNAIKNYKNKIIPFIVVVLLLTVCLQNEIDSLRLIGKLDGKQGIADMFLYALSGMEKYVPDARAKFEVPYFWFTINIYVVYMAGDYCSKELRGIGKQILIRITKKRNWVVGKLIYATINAIEIVTTLVVVLFVYGILKGCQWGCSHNLLSIVISLDASQFGQGLYAIVSFIVLPLLTFSAIGFIHMILSFKIGSILSSLFLIIYIVASAYRNSYLLIGNYSMLLRNQVLLEKGINSYIGLIDAIVIISMTYFVGIICLNNKEFIEKRGK